MTTKVNGYPVEGAWFERQVTYIKLEASGANVYDPADPAMTGVDGFAEKIMRVLQTRGTVIAYNTDGATTGHYILGYAAGLFDSSDSQGVAAQIKTELDAIDTATPVTFTVTVGSGFQVV